MMRIKGIAQILAVAVVLCASSSHAATQELTGNTGGGAFFRIVVPDPWNGDLVIWNHGFSLAPIGPVSDLGPLAGLQLAEGYAVAASSYQQFGWALFKTKNDVSNMYNVFVSNFGVPGQVLLNGASLGALVTAQLAESGNVGNVTGAFPFCGALAGSRNWDAGIDVRLVYDAVCANTPQAFLPGGATGLPEPGFPTYALNPPSPINNGLFMALAINACMGILVPDDFKTPQQFLNLLTFLEITGLPGSFIVTDMGFAVFGMSDLIWNAAKLKGKRGNGNIGVDYPSFFNPTINDTIQRVTATPGGANRLAKSFTPTGAVGDVKIVSMHTDNDGLAIAENESAYADVVPASNLTTAIINEWPSATHCTGITSAELVAGWESMRGWAAGATTQPSAAGIQGLCSFLTTPAGGSVPGPCRINPDCSPGSGAPCAFPISPLAAPVVFPDGLPSMDIRVPPR